MHLSWSFTYTSPNLHNPTSFSPFRMISQVPSKYFIPRISLSSSPYSTHEFVHPLVPKNGSLNADSIASSIPTRLLIVAGHSTRLWNFLINLELNSILLSFSIISVNVSKSYCSPRQQSNNIDVPIRSTNANYYKPRNEQIRLDSFYIGE